MILNLNKIDKVIFKYDHVVKQYCVSLNWRDRDSCRTNIKVGLNRKKKGSKDAHTLTRVNAFRKHSERAYDNNNNNNKFKNNLSNNANRVCSSRRILGSD